MYIDTTTVRSRLSRSRGSHDLESPASRRDGGEPGSIFEDSV